MKTLADAIGKAVRPLLSCGCSHCRDAKKRATAAALDWVEERMEEIKSKYGTCCNGRVRMFYLLEQRIKEERNENAG